MTTEIAAVAIILASATLQGFFGFGYALFGVPLLTWVMGDPKAAVVYLTITVIFHEAVMVLWAFKRAPWPEMLWLVVGIALGVCVGTRVFHSMESRTLMVILGVSLVFMGAWKLVGWQPGSGRSMPFAIQWALTSGWATGFVGVLTCATGPPLIIYAGLRGWSPTFIKAFLQPLFLVAILFRLVGYVCVDAVTWPVLRLGLIAGGPVMLLTWLGLRLAHRVPQRAFDRGFYALVCLLGAITFAKAFAG